MMVCVTAAVAIAGCAQWFAIVGSSFNKADTTKAKYELPEKKTVLVFVDDRRVQTDQPLRTLLTEAINEQLTANKVAAKTIAYSRVLDLAGQARGLSGLEPLWTARKVGADIVLYVCVDKFSLHEEGVEIGLLWRGQLGASISVTDVASGQMLWPRDEPDGMAIKPVDTPTVTHTSPNFGEELTAQVANIMADRVAKMFYDHKITPEEEMGSDPQP